MHLVDEAGPQVLADRRDAAADPHVLAPRAASRARSSAAWMPSVTKWKVVPPSISIGARAWWVSTKTGTWYGGFVAPPAFPALVGPRPAHRAEHVAAEDPGADVREAAAAKSSSMPVVPPARLPNTCWKVRVGRNQSCSASPPTPSGLLETLVGAGAVAVERDREAAHAQFGHDVLRAVTLHTSCVSQPVVS